MKKKLSELIGLFDNSGVNGKPVISNKELMLLRNRLDVACEIIKDLFGTYAYSGLRSKLTQVDGVLFERTKREKVIYMADCGLCGELHCDCAGRMREDMLGWGEYPPGQEEMMAGDPFPLKTFSFKGNAFTLWQINILCMCDANHPIWPHGSFSENMFVDYLSNWNAARKEIHFDEGKPKGERHD